MRLSHLSFAALCGFVSCTPDLALRLSPMALEMPVVDEMMLGTVAPEAACDITRLELCAPPQPRKLPEPPKASATIAPKREAPQTPLVEPEKEKAMERPALPAARSRPKASARRTAPLAPRADLSPIPADKGPSLVARNVALGIGGTGLLVSAVALGANVEARSNVGYAIGGVALGVGVLGLGTAGILTLVQDDDAKDARVRPTGDGLRVSF